MFLGVAPSVKCKSEGKQQQIFALKSLMGLNYSMGH